MDSNDMIKAVNLVVARVPQTEFEIKPKDLNRKLSDYARKALFRCAEINGLSLSNLNQDERGAPVPCDGTYWSISHKPGMVAAVCARFPVGIDVEHIKPRTEPLFDYIADELEWDATGEKNWNNFFRIYTAKEAAVKTSGAGVADLKKVKIRKADGERLTLCYGGNECGIRQRFFQEHLVAVSSFQFNVDWKFLFTEEHL